MNSQRNWRNNLKTGKAANRITTALFIIYLIVICWILLFKLGVRFAYMEKRSVNLVPFRYTTILNIENILNLIIFVPLGFYTGVLYARKIFWSKILFFFMISLIIESLQFILRVGAFDVTDLITNTSGGIIGLIIFKAIDKVVNDRAKTQKFINIIAGTGTALIILLLALLKLNMLPIRYQ